jgi:diguanylate cyclase
LIPPIAAARGFEDASRLVVDFLDEHVPLGLWSVSRFDGERQIHLTTAAHAYELEDGVSVPWDSTLCQRMLAGDGPQLAEDARAVPAYAERAANLALEIGTYVGLPIRRGDGALFGTLCGLDPSVGRDDLVEQRPLLEVLVGLLGVVLDADIVRSDLATDLERAELLAASDPLTGLHNRRGWDRFLEHEEARHRRFGDPATIVVVDLDVLKVVNDRDGHEAGDRLLRTTAATLRRTVRTSDFLARLGGDEFGIVADRTTATEAPLLVRRLRVALEGAGVAASIGTAAYDPEDGLAGAWSRADQAMYDDKARRRGSASPGVRSAAAGDAPGP